MELITEVICFKFQPELVSSLKSPREITKILDTDWCGSDRPVLATADGCIHVSDLTLKKYVSPIEDKDLSGKDTSSLSMMSGQGRSELEREGKWSIYVLS